MNVFHRVTLRTLQKNRSRTLVTIVGVILSAAMFTAVTVSIASLQGYLRDCDRYQTGDWHLGYDTVPSEDLPRLLDDELVERAACAQELGYAALDTANDYKPYLYVLGADGPFFEAMPVHLTRGRLPENGGELLLPDHLEENGQMTFALGDTLTLDLGRRLWEGEALGQNTPYCAAEGDSPAEALEVLEQRRYTVVGFYARPDFENYSAPGYTALTGWDAARGGGTVSVYFRLTSPRDAFDFAEGLPIDGQAHYAPPGGSAINSDLLRDEGVSRYDTFYTVLYGMALILTGIIVVGSVSLIYNAFSISVSHRTRQFGLLGSVGATRPQLRRMVRAEALMVSAVGIPLGLAAGVAGIGVTLRLLGDRFVAFYGVGTDAVAMRLRVPPLALAAAALLALLTVLLSAHVPARRAMRIAPMEAIRLSRDVSAPQRTLRDAPWTLRLFGLPGLLARRHFQRDRRRYRATVFSLAMSVVLFVATDSFCTYMTESVTGTFQDCDYDVSYQWAPEAARDLTAEAAALRGRFLALPEVEEASAVVQYAGSWSIPAAELPDETRRRLEDAGHDLETGYQSNVFLLGVDQETYRAYLREEGLDPAVYLDAEAPRAVALARSRTFNPATGRQETLELLRPEADRAAVAIWNQEKYDAYFEDCTPEEMEAMTDADWEAARPAYEDEYAFPIGARVERLPLGLSSADYWGLYLVLPMDYLVRTVETEWQASVYCRAPDHAGAMTAMTQALRDAGREPGGLWDAHEAGESERNLVVIVQVFAYGFIALISLIALANVCNTVSTNLRLRRQEFAMLQSVGMTRRGLRRMLGGECLLCGLKALLFGLPPAFGVTYLIYRAVSAGYDTAFRLPWAASAIAAGSVLLMVFLTMLYGLRGLQREDPIEALRCENL